MESSLTSPMSPHSPRIGIWGSYGLRLFPDECFNHIPSGTEDTEYFQPEQKFRLQEPMDGRGDRGYVSW